MEKKVVSAKDIAKIANVSQSTVSRVFTPGASVAEKTRRRVLKIAEKYNYRPNALARGLIKNKTNMIGLLMKEIPNPFYHEVLGKFTQTLKKKGYSVLFSYTEHDEIEEEDIHNFLEYNVDGMIVMDALLSSRAARKLEQNDIPVTLFNREANYMNSVSSDHVYAGKMTAAYVVEQGYKDVVFLTGNTKEAEDHRAGFIHTIKGTDVHVRTLPGDETYETAFQQTTRMLEEGHQPEVIIGANDVTAFGVLDALKEKGVRVPAETAVIGFDNMKMATWPKYMLSTWAHPIDQMVDAAVSLIAGGKKKDIVSIKLKGHLIHRHSTK